MTIVDILTLILSGSAFVFSLITYILGVSRQKKQDTIDAFNNLQNQVLDEIAHYTKGNVEEIAKHPRSEEYKKLAALLARCEHFAVGVNTNIYSRKIVYRLSGVHFRYLYDKIKPVIDKKRKIGKSGKAYAEFEKMVDAINRQNK